MDLNPQRTGCDMDLRRGGDRMLTPGRRSRLLALIAFGLAILAMAVMAIQRPPPVGPRVSPGIGPSPASQTPRTTPDEWRWSRIELGRRTAQISDLIATEERLIAVGRSNGRAAAWSSADGQSWARAQIEVGRLPDHPWGGAAVLTEFAQVFESGGELLALGMPSYLHPLGYVSHDGGLTWQQDFRFDWQDERDVWWEGGWTMGDVVAGGPGFVALGHGHIPGFGLYIPMDRMWLSADGHVWKRLPMRQEPQLTLDINTLEADGNLVYAVGDRLWRSTDGIRWQPDAVPVNGEAGSVSALLVEAGHMLLGGARGISFESEARRPAKGRLWSSSGDAGWTVELKLSPLSWIQAIERTSHGVAAVTSQDRVVTIHIQDAAGRWRPLPRVEHDLSFVSAIVEYRGALVLGGGLHALGADGFPQPNRAAIWVGVPPQS
jgi:hypothetical protein